MDSVNRVSVRIAQVQDYCHCVKVLIVIKKSPPLGPIAHNTLHIVHINNKICQLKEKTQNGRIGTLKDNNQTGSV